MRSQQLFIIMAVQLGILSPLLAAATPAPRFEEYPVSEKTVCRPVKLNLASYPRAWQFRTHFREGAQRCPDFAGHYIVITWGCGSPCTEVALIDARNGKIYFAPFLERTGDDYRLGSRLFIVNPKETPLFPTSWWVWEKNQFTLIKE